LSKIALSCQVTVSHDNFKNAGILEIHDIAIFEAYEDGLQYSELGGQISSLGIVNLISTHPISCMFMVSLLSG
jgi:hypothetical protein